MLNLEFTIHAVMASAALVCSMAYFNVWRFCVVGVTIGHKISWWLNINSSVVCNWIGWELGATASVTGPALGWRFGSATTLAEVWLYEQLCDTVAPTAIWFSWRRSLSTTVTEPDTVFEYEDDLVSKDDLLLGL